MNAKSILEFIFDRVKVVKNYKLLFGLVISAIVILILFYPIIDANVLYYKRINNRISILDKITKLDEDKIDKNENLKKEYNSILKEMNSKDNNYLNNIIYKEKNEENNKTKFGAMAWLFFIVSLIVPFTKDNKKNKRFTLNNIFAGIVCFVIAYVMGIIGEKIPTIINVWVNVILYQIILFFISYCIATAGNKIK